MAVSKVKIASAWQAGLLKVKTATGWEAFPHYKDNSVWVNLYTEAPPSVSPNTAPVFRLLATGATCYSIIEYRNDGIEYHNTVAGSSTDATVSRGAWLDAGFPHQVWIERTVVGDSLNAFDPGTGRKPLTTTRKYGLSQVGGGFNERSCTVTFDFYDALTGGSLLATQDIVLTAQTEV